MQDLDSIPELPVLLNKFKNPSGLEINGAKTEAMWLGNGQKATLKLRSVFACHEIRYKSWVFFFSYDSRKATEFNFIEKIWNLENTLNCWKRRNHTLLGKINVVKTLGLSKFIYNIKESSIIGEKKKR